MQSRDLPWRRTSRDLRREAWPPITSAAFLVDRFEMLMLCTRSNPAIPARRAAPEVFRRQSVQGWAAGWTLFKARATLGFLATTDTATFTTMATIDVFSKRNQPVPDVYVYDELPEKLRVQIVHILEDCLGRDFQIGNQQGWSYIAKAVAREHGILELPGRRGRYGHRDAFTDCLNYVLQAEAVLALDLIEVSFRILERFLGNNLYHRDTRGDPAAAVEELNQRFRENGSGYQYENGEIVRVDSQLVHADVVRPTITLLQAKGFEGPNAEFLAAHEHFRHGRVEAAITDACKAFESTMKAICDARQWKYDAKAAAGALIKTIIERGLVPSAANEHFNALEKLLLGVATVRNKNAGHGAGSKPRDVPDHLAAYALHLAASNIVYLVETHKASP